MIAKTQPQFQIHPRPIADPAAVIQDDRVRFTVLASRLLRLEYSPQGRFEDRPSQAFWYRAQPVPQYTCTRAEGRIEIDTEHLHLQYQVSEKGFAPHTLIVQVKTTGNTWRYGDSYWRARNLMGTARTLDGINGRVDLGAGLNSRAGWAVVDDSKSLVFNADCWLEPRALTQNQDLYFFGYGHDYPGAVIDFQKIAGETPLIPRFSLGNWWSRYWAYTDAELKALMEDFQRHDVPLSVCIIDMDWHITKTGNNSSGWTGYTWNKELFPDPPEMIEWLHSKGLKTALNLHPAEGIYPHEEQYPRFAAWMGIDPDSKEPVAFDISDPHFTEGYFEILHHPYEQIGVDFWWIDWQQGALSRLPGLDPLWWINHLHFHDLARDGRKRPFIFSRWGGLGNHRYPIGFSGDTVISWESLANQPAFTATAANVGYGWWSHDIGGHMGGIEDDELYTRWVQYGVFSPILRMHCTNNPFHERRPWGRGPAADRAATAALRLRHKLIPYIYAMAWRNHHEGIPMVVPLYFTHPEESGAYDCVWQEYWFGSEFVAAPFTAPHDEDTGLARQRVWLPEGDWFNFFSGEHVAGHGWQIVYGDLEAIPVFARAGAIVPMDMNPGWGSENTTSLQVHLFAGASNRFDLYDDDGETNEYRHGKYALTPIILDWHGHRAVVTINPVSGDAAVIPASRKYQLVLHGVTEPKVVELRVNHNPLKIDYAYDASAEQLCIAPFSLDPNDQAVLSVAAKGEAPWLMSSRDRRAETLRQALLSFKLDTWTKAALARDLPALLSGEKTLLAYAGLQDAQITALTHILRLSRD